jgi:hypothetical protein
MKKTTIIQFFSLKETQKSLIVVFSDMVFNKIISFLQRYFTDKMNFQLLTSSQAHLCQFSGKSEKLFFTRLPELQNCTLYMVEICFQFTSITYSEIIYSPLATC